MKAHVSCQQFVQKLFFQTNNLTLQILHSFVWVGNPVHVKCQVSLSQKYLLQLNIVVSIQCLADNHISVYAYFNTQEQIVCKSMKSMDYTSCVLDSIQAVSTDTFKYTFKLPEGCSLQISIGMHLILRWVYIPLIGSLSRHCKLFHMSTWPDQ